VQASGIFNFAKEVQGLQASGVLNFSKEMKGIQASGVINLAKKVKGVQVGLINYADSLSGMQIGLFNLSKYGGYKAIEMSVNEINNFNFAFKSGTRKFYTSFLAGISSKSNSNVWTYGFGLGTHTNLNKFSDLNIESNLQHVNVGTYTNSPQEWLQLGLNWNIHLGKRLELVAGPTFNALFSYQDEDISNEVFPSFIKPRKSVNGDFATNKWVGGNIAFRLVL
jgi:hypothetical protein